STGTILPGSWTPAAAPAAAGVHDRRGPAQKPAVILVNSRSPWEMPLQLDTTPPPGQGRSRFTDQNASRARPCDFAQSRIEVQVAGLVSSCWSDRPFMPEMPMCAYAVASDQPNADLSAFFRPSAALTVLVYMFAPPPKSNGMIVNTSMFALSAAARVMSRLPQ